MAFLAGVENSPMASTRNCATSSHSRSPDTAAPCARLEESLVRYAASAVVASRPSQSPRLDTAIAAHSRRNAGRCSSTVTELGSRFAFMASSVEQLADRVDELLGQAT